MIRRPPRSTLTHSFPTRRSSDLTWNLAHPVGWRRFDFEVNQAAQQPPDQRKDVARNQFCTPQEVELYVRAVGLEPVLMLTDSPWVQVVARTPDAGSDDALRAKLAAAAAPLPIGKASCRERGGR